MASPTSSWDWQPIWETLSDKYRLIAVDMLGFGFSDKPDNKLYSIHLQADLVEALIEARQLKQFHVLAHDYGDTVAQELLARQLEGSGSGEWLSCCFLNGGLFPETHHCTVNSKAAVESNWLVTQQVVRLQSISGAISALFLALRASQHKRI